MSSNNVAFYFGNNLNKIYNDLGRALHAIEKKFNKTELFDTKLLRANIEERFVNFYGRKILASCVIFTFPGKFSAQVEGTDSFIDYEADYDWLNEYFNQNNGIDFKHSVLGFDYMVPISFDSAENFTDYELVFAITGFPTGL